SPGGSTARFTGSLSNPAKLNATSIRIDHTFNQRLAIFGRYNDAPSSTQTPFGPSTSLSDSQNKGVDTRTLTAGLNVTLNSSLSNMLRANYSTQNNDLWGTLNSLGGATPFNASLLLGVLPTAQSAAFFAPTDIASYIVGNQGKNRTRQLNFT